jgi:hypothetical protein
MQMNNSLKDMFNPVLREIKQYFRFLLEMGYQIHFANYKACGMVSWDIILKSPRSIVHIYQERSEVCINFAPLNVLTLNNEIGIRDQIAIQTMIYYVSKGQKFIGLFNKDFYHSRKKQFGALSDLMKEYIDQLLPYFDGYEFQGYKSDLLAAQREYNNLLVEKYFGSSS